MKTGFVYNLSLGIITFIFSLLSPLSFASGGGGSFAEGLNYLHITPPLIVNYGGVGKVKYIKAEISMRVEDNHSAVEVTHHMPLIRDTLIMFLSSMSDEQINTGEGKELMRQQALAKVNEVLALQISVVHDKDSDKDKKAAKNDKGKEKSGKDKPAQDAHDKKTDDHATAGLVSDLFFNNLVVQK